MKVEIIITGLTFVLVIFNIVLIKEIYKTIKKIIYDLKEVERLKKENKRLKEMLQWR